MMTARRRKRLILARVWKGGDIQQYEFAVSITGKLYFVKSITGQCALCWDCARPGHNDIIPLNLLMKA